MKNRLRYQWRKSKNNLATWSLCCVLNSIKVFRRREIFVSLFCRNSISSDRLVKWKLCLRVFHEWYQSFLNLWPNAFFYFPWFAFYFLYMKFNYYWKSCQYISFALCNSSSENWLNIQTQNPGWIVNYMHIYIHSILYIHRTPKDFLIYRYHKYQTIAIS